MKMSIISGCDDAIVIESYNHIITWDVQVSFRS